MAHHARGQVLIDAQLPRVRIAGPVPPGERRLLGVCLDRVLVHGARRIRENLVEHHEEAGEHSLRGSPDEHVGGVGQPHLAKYVRIHAQPQIELDEGGVELERREGQAREYRHVEGRVDHVEQHLGERRPGRHPVDHDLLDQPLERRVLVRVGFQRGFLHPREQLEEGRIAGQVGAEDQGIDEGPHQALGLEPGSVCDRRADRDVLLPGIPSQHELEAREQRHERRDAVPDAEPLQRVDGRQRQVVGDAAASAGREPRRRDIGRQRHGLQAVETSPPERHLGRENRHLRLGPLPGGVVGVFQRQRGQLGLPALEQPRVGMSHLAQQDAVGPVVADHMVDHPQQHVLVVIHPDQGDPIQAGSRQVERLQGELFAEAPRLRFAVLDGHASQVNGSELTRTVLLDKLHRLAVDHVEAGAERLVTLDHPVHRLTQADRIQGPVQTQRERHVVRAGLRVEVLDEPHAALGERHPQRAPAPDPVDRRAGGRRGSVGLGPQPRDLGREVGDRGIVEQGPQRQLDVQSDAYPRDHLRGHQGVPAQIEEVLVHPEVLRVQHLAPDIPHRLLDGAARDDRLGLPVLLRRRQRLAIELAVGQRRQLRQDHERRGHHVFGQQLAQPAPSSARSSSAPTTYATRRFRPG